MQLTTSCSSWPHLTSSSKTAVAITGTAIIKSHVSLLEFKLSNVLPFLAFYRHVHLTSPRNKHHKHPSKLKPKHMISWHPCPEVLRRTRETKILAPPISMKRRILFFLVGFNFRPLHAKVSKVIDPHANLQKFDFYPPIHRQLTHPWPSIILVEDYY